MTQVLSAIFLLLSLAAFGRSPAIENLEKWDKEQIQREKGGEAYSGKYHALSGNQKQLKQDPPALMSFFMLILLIALPFAMWHLIMRGKSTRDEYSEEVQGQVYDIEDFRHTQEKAYRDNDKVA